MSDRRTIGYVRGGGLLAVASASALVLLLRGLAPELPLVWAAGGFLGMAAIGIVGGGRLVAAHGREDRAFVAALGGAMLARLALAAAGAVAAGLTDRAALVALCAGLGAGFLPLQVFEVLWFVRKTPALTAAGEG